MVGKSENESEVVRAELDKILGSATFSQSESLKRFLRYVVEAKLDGRDDELKELALGSEVFDRGDSYDPRLDPIVRVQATRLRSKLRDYYLEEGSGNELLIELPKGSYVPTFQFRSSETSPVPLDRGPEERSRSSRALLLLLGAFGLVALLGFWILSRPTGLGQEKEGLPTVLVLPFTDMSPGGDQQYFGDGLAEEITTTLGRVKGLKVVPRTSAFRAEASQEDLATLAARLHADLVLQGSVRKSGDVLRIQVQLIQASTGRQLWTQTYDRPADDAFRVQEEIARSVARTISDRLTVPAAADDRYVPTPSAYDDYLRGRFERERNSPASLLRSIRSFEAAVEADPDFAPAYAGLVQSYVLNVLWGTAPLEETRDLAKLASEKALALAGENSEALAAAASYSLVYEWDVDGAEALLAAPGRTDPGNDEVEIVSALVDAARGRLDAAIERLDPLVEENPSPPFVPFLRASLSFHRGRYPEAASRCRSLLEIDDDYPLTWHLLARVQDRLGESEGAHRSLERFEGLAGRTSLLSTTAAVLLAHEGKPEEARGILTDLRRRAATEYVSPAFLARALAALGDTDLALDELDKAVEEHSFPLVFLAVDPDYEPLRSHPRFQALLDRLGLR